LLKNSAMPDYHVFLNPDETKVSKQFPNVSMHI